MSGRPTCKTCAYWFLLPEETDEDGEVGLCRRFPPGIPSHLRTQTPDGMSMTTWQSLVSDPITEDGHWCGEHPDFPAYVAGLKTSEVSR